MLKELAKAQPQQSAIVGVDGQPIDQKPVIDPVEAAANYQKDMLAKQRKQVDEYHHQMGELTKDDPDAMDLSGVMLLCHRMIHWAKSELYGHCGATTDLIEFMDRYMREAAGGQRGFTLKQLIVQMKQEAVPLADKFYRRWEAQRTRRLHKLKKIAQNLEDEGVYLPTVGMRAAMEGIFKPGELIVIHGERQPVSATIRHIITSQSERVVGSIYRLSYHEQTDETPNPHIIALPMTWWKDAAKHIKSLYEVLKPVVENTAALVTVDDLETLYTGAAGDAPSHMRKQLSLSRLYQWARENYVAVIVGDVVTLDDLDTRLYGPIKHFGATSVELDGVVSLFINAEPVETKK